MADTDTSDPKPIAEKAEAAYQEGDFESAARLYGEAASAFQALGNNLDAAEAKNNQSVAFLQAGDPQSALDAAAGTEEVFAATSDARRQGIALANQATPLQSLGQLDQALEKYHQAAEAFKKAEDYEFLAIVMQAVANIHLRRGKIFEALGAMRVGLADLKNPTFMQKILKGLLQLKLW